MIKKLTPVFIGIMSYAILIFIFLYPNLYKIVVPFGKQIFGTKEAVWTAVGILSAIATFFVSMSFNELEKKRNTEVAIEAFRMELVNNIDNIFSKEVERPSYFEAFENLKRNYSDIIKDKNKFEELRILYDELTYYQEILKIYWHLENKNGSMVTEKQFWACERFIKYFNGVGCYDPAVIMIPASNQSSWIPERDLAIYIKDRDILRWKE